MEALLKPGTCIWCHGIKKVRIPTDLTENVIRNYALQNDLVDIKVCAVSSIWSGLKLDEPQPTPPKGEGHGTVTPLTSRLKFYSMQSISRKIM